MPVKGVLNKGRVPVKIWADLSTVESAALDQLGNIAQLPFVFKHVAVMPDVHLGKGATVGSVVATQGAVCPAAVGVDIGCGMMAVEFPDLTREDLGDLSVLRHSFERSVPVGHNGNSRIGDDVKEWDGWNSFDGLHNKVQKLQQRAQSQLGSLGGGNHFIEVCLDEEGTVWLMLHSGSRNIGKTLAEEHISQAKSVIRQMFISLPDPDLAYFAAGTGEYKRYLDDLYWAQAYAMKNREVMMGRIVKDLSFHVGHSTKIGRKVNCHHNFAVMENHYGENVLVTRKGAVRARKGDMGIIPGSMGSRSYIVSGLGNPESFDSCSHGAGRRMSRSAAKKQFTVEDLAKQTEGVECRKDVGVVDEIPGAYKDIEEVMENQNDLVAVEAVLKQILCVKG